jgi:hypothetical protein
VCIAIHSDIKERTALNITDHRHPEKQNTPAVSTSSEAILLNEFVDRTTLKDSVMTSPHELFNYLLCILTWRKKSQK